MVKQQVHIRIEPTVYLILKNKGVNISELSNNLLKQYVEYEEIQIPEEITLINEIDKAKQVIQEAEKTIQRCSIMLTKHKEDNEKLSEQVAKRSKAEKEIAQRIIRDL